jgi:4-hydroxybenzoate polyprenyltransferase/phosphoserine phosphatase
MQNETNTRNYSVLVVDIDGTLIRTDLLHESVFALLKSNPLYLFLLPVWLLKGRAHLKQMIAERVDLPVELLPYREEFVEYLQTEKAAGRSLVLATASNIRYAEGIASHLGIFDQVLGSDQKDNLKAARKLAHISEALGGEQFAYAGNSEADVPIWAQAAAAVVVAAPDSVHKKAERIGRVVKVFEEQKNYLTAFFKAIRPHQWLKNLLIFVPLGLAHQLESVVAVEHAFFAFVAFCFCASSVYLLNDMLDLASDRQHPTKRFRPFAAGDLPITYGVIGMGVFLLAAILIALALPRFFFWVLVLYYILTLAYSLWLKSSMLIDALTLASLYTLRLIAGAAAISVEPSFWLLALSMFLFLSLAFIKRYSELLVLNESGRQKLVGRAYRTVDMETLASLGAASGYLAVMVMAFYINSDKVFEQYRRPEALWLFCPMMLYWISRMWVLTRRGEMHDDPVVFTLKDKRTYILGVFALLSLLVANYWSELRKLIPDFFL